MHFNAQNVIMILGDKMLLKDFGTRLKELRETNKISQGKLSENTGIVREQISRIENGNINPTLETLYKISEALNMSLSELLDFKITSNNGKQKPNRSTSSQLKPFVKWAGGKTQLLDVILDSMPINYKTYYEPFVGGGALFFRLQPIEAVISDYNSELISAYKCFKDKDQLIHLIQELKNHQINHDEDYYYKIRAMDREPNFIETPEFIKAARMIYLNKACFNGLYRVNSKGYFNVPSGKYDKVNAYDESLFSSLNHYLSNSKISILNEDFEKAVSSAVKGDFVYFDPPYDVFDEQKNFTTYTKLAFGKDEQIRLANVFKSLSDKGVKVMLSNHNTDFIQELYKDFNIKIIHARRSINSVSSGRGKVEEVLITNYDKEESDYGQ